MNSWIQWISFFLTKCESFSSFFLLEEKCFSTTQKLNILKLFLPKIKNERIRSKMKSLLRKIYINFHSFQAPNGGTQIEHYIWRKNRQFFSIDFLFIDFPFFIFFYVFFFYYFIFCSAFLFPYIIDIEN